MPGILDKASFLSLMGQIAHDTGKSKSEIMEQAEHDLAGMYCRRNKVAISLFAALSRFVHQRGYHPEMVFDLDEVNRLRDESRQRSIVYLVTHKTYLDFFVLFDFLYRQNLATPYIFGGINMSFTGFGSLARRAGGIFIRRSFKDDPVYKAVLQRYIGYLVEGGASFMWAIEGTRSRTGKLLVPRLGLLNYVVSVNREFGEEAVSYIPVSVVYDQIPDVVDMAAQEAGAAKKPESLSWFFRYLHGLGGPFGNIYIRFGDAMALTDTPDAPELASSGRTVSDRQIEIQKLAFEVCYRINEVTPATMTSLVVLVLLCRGNCSRDQIRKDVADLNHYIRKTDRRVIMKQPSRTLATEPAESIEMLLANGVIRADNEGAENLLAVEPSRISEAIYYSNMAVHHFVISAFVEMALVSADGPGGILAECQRLRGLFKFEFFFSRKEVFRRQVERELEEIEPDWEQVFRQGPVAVSSMLGKKPLLVGAGVLSPFVFAYRTVAEVMVRDSGVCDLPDQALIGICLQAGREQGHPCPAASTALLQNGLRLVDSLGLRSGASRQMQAGREALLEELEKTVQALKRLQGIAQLF